MNKLFILLAFFTLISCSTNKKDIVYQLNQVDQIPEYPGGLEAFYSYLKDEIGHPYPQNSNDTSKFFCNFILGSDGRIGNIKIKIGINPTFDSLISKTLEESEIWNPGRKEGKTVPVYMELPFTFLPRKN